MKTNQIMQRDFFGGVVRQEHLTGYFCINDITSIANKYRKNQGLPEARWDKYIFSKTTKEFFHALMKSEDKAEIIRTKRGRGGNTWVHPLVLMDYMMWLSPDFKVKAYEWLYDNLAVYRDNSGESYKKLSSIVQDKYSPAKTAIVMQQIARNIKKVLGVEDWNNTTPEKLKQRDAIHKNLFILLRANVEPNEAFTVAVTEVLDCEIGARNEL